MADIENIANEDTTQTEKPASTCLTGEATGAADVRADDAKASDQCVQQPDSAQAEASVRPKSSTGSDDAVASRKTALVHKRATVTAKTLAKATAGALGRGAKSTALASVHAAATGMNALGGVGAKVAKAGAHAAVGAIKSAAAPKIRQIEGGVCAAEGFRAAGIHCGIRANQEKNDLALIVSDRPASAASVHTTNLVIGAPNTVTKRHLENGVAQAVIVNSGIANTCNADGISVAEETCTAVGAALDIDANDVVVASTGIIGQPLDVDKICGAIPDLVIALDACDTDRCFGSHEAAKAIMTTDTKMKEIAVEFKLGGKVCHMGGIAKGSGMIHPNMATMLVFITTDVDIAPALLQEALSGDIATTFNMLSIDGDTSTNDMVAVLANGAAGNARIARKGRDFRVFMRALNSVTVQLCREIAADGEGATKLIECRVEGAPDDACARRVAKSVVCSNLVKAAMFGADANWGRVLCAIGYSGAPVDVSLVGVSFKSKRGIVEVCRDGAAIPFSERKAKRVLKADEIEIIVALNNGRRHATAWGCDLTYDYVKINGSYRS